MGVWARIGRDVRFAKGLSALLKRVKDIDHDSPNLICDDLEAAVDKFGPRVALEFEDRKLSYRDLDMLANRFAHWAKGRGVRRGDTVALFMPNRLEYVAIWMGMAKIGAATALINNNLTGQALAHCLNISGATHCIADRETEEAFEAVRGGLQRSMMLWVLGLPQSLESSDRRALDPAIKGASAVRPDRSVREGLKSRDTALYIYTSGTTGLPKAARVTHARAQLYMRAFAGATQAKAEDRIYVVLPLYHATGGLCGIGAALLNGGAAVIRKKFSATHFWTDVVEKDCTMFVYIGELCRYLVNSPEHELERKHRLRLAFGNGLRPEVWTGMQARFRLPRILEFYGSTEGNVSLFNFDGKAGAIGRIPGFLRKSFNIRLIRLDLETEEVVRGPNGLCQETRAGEVGEAIGEIKDDARHGFSGYADKAASEKKILRDVFKKGDAWFRTGDLMRQDTEGYFYFVDRLGDTFRWKGENVSTTEVAERLAAAPGVLEVTVYGVEVPGAEGKAGMASVVVQEPFDVAAFGRHVDMDLPVYARPLFVRLQHDIETTGTFKYRKIDLVREGFDPDRIADPVFFRDPETGGYVRLTRALHKSITTGQIKF